MRTRLLVVRATAKPVRVREAASVDLPQDSSAVWSFMWDPASSVRLSEMVEVGVTLPGGPTGLGEIQVFVERTKNGRRGHLHEVVEFEVGRRAVTRSLVSDYPVHSVLSLESLGPRACRLTQEFWADIPAGVPVATVRGERELYRGMLHAMMQRLTELATDPLWP